MAKTFRITIEYTSTHAFGDDPAFWDIQNLLKLDPKQSDYTFKVQQVPVNQTHVQNIMNYNVPTAKIVEVLSK